MKSIRSRTSAAIAGLTACGLGLVIATETGAADPAGRVAVEVILENAGERVVGDDTVVWFSSLKSVPATAGHIEIAQNDKQFEPRISVASVGSTVDFPNYDRVFHNVFSLSTPKTFDLGLYRKGKSKAVRFDDPGLVQVFCNIHPHMAAYLMIVDSRSHAVADAQGVAIIEGLPAGRHTIEGWSLRGGRWSREIKIREGATTDVIVELDISNWRETTHLNKHGKEYPPPDDDEFRY